MRRYYKMSLNAFLVVVIGSLTILSSCNLGLPVLLSKNREKIDPSVEGVWKLHLHEVETEDKKNPLVGIKLKDEYYAFINFLEDEEKNKMGLTFHKFNDQTIFCIRSWNKGKQEGDSFVFEKLTDMKIHLRNFEFSNRISETRRAALEKTMSESQFESMLTNGELYVSPKQGYVLEKLY